MNVLIPMDREELGWLAEIAALFEIIYVDVLPAGFIIALREEWQFESSGAQVED